ncbi:AAA family ATPase [Methanobrevibacter sp.]|uniref:AAA family ATPase n=1 Tax=Methanobrevibacter sp. TaxID=66852 RepID=UPI00388D2325
MVNMWMVRAGKNAILIDEFEKLNIVAIGWELGDLTNKTPDEIKKLVYEKYPNESNHTKGKYAANIIKFCHQIKEGDYVLSNNSWNHHYLFGKIVSNYYKSSLINDEYSDVRDVEWLCKIPKDNLEKSTQNTLGALMTVFKIEGDAKEDILNIFNSNSIEKSASIIRKYLNENNLGNFKNEGNEQAYINFKELFSPEILKNLEGMDILNTIFLHDGDKNNLCYYLEFSKDYTFAGSISGGSAHKYSLFKHNETHQWTAGSPKKSSNVSEDEAIEIGGKIRDALVNGANLIKNSNLVDVNDYIQLENNLGDIFSDCTTSHLNQWVHKYFTLIFPDKFPVVHWDNMKKDFLKKFNISPEEWYYALDGQLVLLSNKAGIKGYSLFEDEILNLFKNKPIKPLFECDLKRNIIYFGAPGTGKSYNLNQDKDNLLKNYPNNYERVTFHPDYSYANFVGTYKPVPENNSITYKYVPGPFMRVLKKAIEHPNEPYLLIIEEINRANVAAVFGDVFQLLDRENNVSIYPIDTTEDMKTYLNKDKIKIPENLFIWATMNSADQGVFPMDTAFKRRWDFKYFSINHNEKLIENINVNLNGIDVNWNLLRKAINDELLSYKINEDKLMGPFFAFNEFMEKEIDVETFKDIFKNKIIMYLFEDAARAKRNDLFKGAKTKEYVTYSEICEKFDEIGIEIFCDNIKSKFISDDE